MYASIFRLRPQKYARSNQSLAKITSPNPILKKGYWVAQDFVGPGEISGYFKDMDDVNLQSLLEDTVLVINAITADPSIAPKHKKRGFETGIYMIQFEQRFRAKRKAAQEISKKPRKQKGWDRGL